MSHSASGAPRSLPKARLPLWRPVFLQYFVNVSASTGVLVFFILLGVETVFLLELIVSHLLPHVLRYQAGMWNLIVLLGLSAPQAVFISLPTALLIGVHMVFLNRREASEFMVLANMGQSTKPLIALVLLYSVAALGVSTLMSSFVEPQLNYQLRQRMFDIKYETLRSGNIGAGKFRDFGEFSAFAAKGSLGKAASNIFILQDIGLEQYRLVMARKSTRLTDGVAAQVGANSMNVVLENAISYKFELTTDRANRVVHCAACAPQFISPLGVQRSSAFFVNGPEMQIPQAGARGALDELHSDELLRRNLDNPQIVKTLTKRLIRDLLCFVVPLLALMGVALTNQKTALLVLPALSTFVLSVSFFGPQFANQLAPLGFWGAFSIMGIITGLLSLGIVLTIMANEARCCYRQGMRY